jgi:hypothetical protein
MAEVPGKPFVKGDPRCWRQGRPPKEKSITNFLDEYLRGGAEPGITRLQQLVTKLYDLAVKGDVNAMKYIIDRIDGKTPETFTAVISTFSEWRKQLQGQNEDDSTE